MSTKLSITREDDGHRGRWYAGLDDGAEAEMTYRHGPDKVISIDHTFVPESHRGQGIAEALMNAAIASARADGLKIRPLCSYAVLQFRRHKDWADLLAP
ncbi:hypothetical protein SAMN02983003_3795 [Devosia enhydra]|uniref:Uncharacterized protein n=1 Tax=Devosia enhydra TaxID=665118 RepID=A0A1K2I2J7_9HYPH|nr:GNAT family N-acetyltransferase [Devosia enhydra]SFZ86605.1 hypothetical protein SAMN02983003_3795 [Devosia enhydra]